MDWKDGVILAGAGLGILAWDTWRSYKALKVDVAGYRVYNVDIANNSAVLQIDVELTNPLLLGLTLYSIVGDVYIDGNLVARINQRFDYYVRGKRTHIIPVVFVCDVLGVSRLILQQLTARDVKLPVRFVGELRLGQGGVVPIPVDFEDIMAL